MDKLLSIGKILNFHGIHGEVKVGYTPGKEDQLEQLEEVLVVKEDEASKLNIESIRFHKGSAIIKFKELNTIDEAVEYKGAFLKIEKSKLTELLDEDEFYIDDLVGLKVIDREETVIGVVDFIAKQGSGEILAIKNTEGKQCLVPFVKDLVPVVDVKGGLIIINNLPGLLDNE